MAFSGVVGAICCDTGNVLIGGDLGQQFGQHGGIPDVAAGDLDRPDLQRLFVDPEMDLAPDAAFCPAVLARVPLTFPFDLDPGAVDQEMQRTLRAPMRDAGCSQQGSFGDGSVCLNQAHPSLVLQATRDFRRTQSSA